MSQQEKILEDAKRFLKEEIAPRANDIDESVDALRAALDALCERELMALRRPAEYGGPEFSEPHFREYQETVARYSGSLAFLQTQHQSAVSMIAKCANEVLKRKYLPGMGNGERLVGIGFSQLRRPGEPIMRAEECDGGYRLNGTVPWVTGYSLYGEFLIGAQLPSGEAVFGVVPFQYRSEDGSTITFSEPMRLAAMESPQTVSAELKNWYLPDSLVAYVRPAGWITNNDMINITLQGFFALGCARAGLDIVWAAYEHKEKEFVRQAWQRLDSELTECREQIVGIHTGEDLEATVDEKLRLRAWAIDLAARCAHAAVASSSGAANSLKHPAQRVYREALVYTVSAQTAPIMEATLERLAGRGGA